MQRRKFLKNSATLMSALPLINVSKFNFLNTPSSDEVAKIMIGKFHCTIFRDFMFKYQVKEFFSNANEEELNKELTRYQIQGDTISAPFSPILIQQNDKKILIDTGIGFTEKPVIVNGNSIVLQGKLQQLLQKENIKKEDITDVVITHFHPDHIGGIFNDDAQLNFPNARFHMHENEWNYWHSPQSVNQPDIFKHFIEKSINGLKDLNLNLIKGDFAEVLPGITTVKTDGHTEGSIAVIVHSEKKHLLYISDTFLHPLHIERLDWQTIYDTDHEKARQSRIKILELAKKENMLVHAFHFNFPGLGRVNKLANSWTWKYSKK